MINFSPTEVFYPGGNEVGANIFVYNHPKYERTEDEFMHLVTHLSEFLKNKFRQWRVESDCNGFLVAYGPICDVPGEPLPEGTYPVLEKPKSNEQSSDNN
jgi:hypothetical protein